MTAPGLSALDLATFDAAWDRNWPDCRPVGHELRWCAHETWVRFHSLPGSKRYAESAEEYAEILNRHLVLIQELAAMVGDGPQLLQVVTAAWSQSGRLRKRDRKLRRAFPSAVHWRTFPLDPDDAETPFMHLYVGEGSVNAPTLEALLLLVADDQAWDVIITDPQLNWLYHPYDGGGDVIAPDRILRDGLRKKYARWLSDYPLGL